MKNGKSFEAMYGSKEAKENGDLMFKIDTQKYTSDLIRTLFLPKRKENMEMIPHEECFDSIIGKFNNPTNRSRQITDRKNLQSGWSIHSKDSRLFDEATTERIKLNLNHLKGKYGSLPRLQVAQKMTDIDPLESCDYQKFGRTGMLLRFGGEIKGKKKTRIYGLKYR